MAWFWKSKSSKKNAGDAGKPADQEYKSILGPEIDDAEEPQAGLEVEEDLAEVQAFSEDDIQSMMDAPKFAPIGQHAAVELAEEEGAFLAATAEPVELPPIEYPPIELPPTHEELQASLKAAQAELESLRTQSEATIAEFTAKSTTVEATLAETQQKLQLLDEANVTMAKMLGDRDQRIQELEKLESQSKTQQELAKQKDDQIGELESKLAASSTQSTTIIAELKQQIDSLTSKCSSSTAQVDALNHQIDSLNQQVESLRREVDQAHQTASAQISEVEQRQLAISASSTDRIAALEQQLAESEARSANRAEQRSALLRNLMEIHRLSSTSTKSDVPSESLKFRGESEERSGNAEPVVDEETVPPNPFYTRGNQWSESSESESA